MKKTIFLSVLLTLTTISYAYVPMLRTGRSWNYFHYSSTGFTYSYHTDNLSILSDTVINGQTYYKSDFTKGLLREDVDNEKVYLLDTDGVEHLLYDFTLSVGDSAEVYFHNTATEDSALYSRIYITGIDTLVDSVGTVLRVFNYLTYDATVSYTEPGYYIERYGAHHGLIDYISRIGYSGGASTELRCAYDESGNLTYMNHEVGQPFLGDDCNGSGDAVENILTNSATVVYSDGLLTISADNFSNADIYSTTGQLVASISTPSASLSLTPGIYFARIASNGKTATERFVVK